jgi:hypothetical protein
MSSEISSHVLLAEPMLAFHPERTADRDIHPLRGLLHFGPFSSGLVPDPIRVATVAPSGESGRLYSFLKELNASAKATERLDYLQDWPGFHRVFGLHMRAAGGGCHVELDHSFENEFKQSPTPHIVLADRLLRAIQGIEARRAEFDVLFIYLPQKWSTGFTGGPSDDFNLHDHIKATTAVRRLPVQIVREDSALAYRDRASVMWRIGLALYAKAGGVPWKLAETDPETAYIGISYAIRPKTSNRPRFVTCCSQVFDADGAGLEFVAYDAHEVEIHNDDNPFLSRAEMFRVMTRSMDLYRRRHAGRSPRRVMVHKTTEFKREEVDGCMEAFHLCEAVDLVQVVESVAWRAAQIQKAYGSNKGEASAFPLSRGSLLGIGPGEALLWTHGSVRGIGAKDYFQGARSTPRPLRLVRHAGHGTWDEAAFAILSLTKMDWNNDALYDPLPVTLEYAKVLAGVVKRMTVLGSAPYQFRFFM